MATAATLCRTSPDCPSPYGPGQAQSKESFEGPKLSGGPGRQFRSGIDVVTSPTVVASLVPVIAHAVAVFGDEQKATHWLSTPLGIFGNRTPAELMVSAEGIALVERTLTRIEHNIPS